MSGIRLHPKHCLAPAILVCRICGKETNGLALLGISADKIMREAGQSDGYHEYGHNKLVDQEPCNECKSYLDNGGTIIIAQDIEQYLRLDRAQVDSLVMRVADAKGRILDFEAMRGKIITLRKAFWRADDEGNIRLRDPKEWTD